MGVLSPLGRSDDITTSANPSLNGTISKSTSNRSLRAGGLSLTSLKPSSTSANPASSTPCLNARASSLSASSAPPMKALAAGWSPWPEGVS